MIAGPGPALSPAAPLSPAVMARRVESRGSLDDFPTPPWAARALAAHVIPQSCRGSLVWEPACGRGHMARALADDWPFVIASDVADYSAESVWSRGGERHLLGDFLDPAFLPEAASAVDWVVTNPPFRLAERFIQRAHDRAPRRGIAMFVRTAFLESVGRWRLFRRFPPAIVAQFAERVPIHKGRLAGPGGSTATAYCWMVWLSGWSPASAGTRLIWIPPCRAALTREGDYPPEAA
jgi:hypothetical protein